MDIVKVRELSDAELETALKEAKQDLWQARFALSLPGVRGLHLADFRRDGALGRLCADLGLAPRSERETHADRSPVIV